MQSTEPEAQAQAEAGMPEPMPMPAPTPPRFAVVGMASRLAAANNLAACWSHLISGIPALDTEGGRRVEGASQPADRRRAVNGIVEAALHDVEDGRQRRHDAQAKIDEAEAKAEEKAEADPDNARAKSKAKKKAGPKLADAVPAALRRVFVAYSGPSALLPEVADVSSYASVEYHCFDPAAGFDAVWQALRDDRCDLALLVGAQFLDAYAQGDEAEGIAAVAIQPLPAAQAQQNRIYAELLGLHTSAHTSPAEEAQALRAALDAAALVPAQIGFVESSAVTDVHARAHDLGVLNTVFEAESYPTIALSASRVVFGELGAAAPCAGLVLVALVCHHRALPPLATDADMMARLSSSRLMARWSAWPWLAAGERRHGLLRAVHAGRQIHTVLAATAAEESVGWTSMTPWRCELVLLSAPSRAALAAQIKSVQTLLGGTDAPVLAQLACVRARQFKPEHAARLAVVATDLADLAAKLGRAMQRLKVDTAEQWHEADGISFGGKLRPTKFAFMFPGVGFPSLAGGYAERVSELAIHFPEMCFWLDFAVERTRDDGTPCPMQFQLYPPPYSPIELLQRVEQELRVSQRASMGTMSTNLGSFYLMRSFGFDPAAMGGFSMGEWSALVAAGLIDQENTAPRDVDSDAREASTAVQVDDFDCRWAMVSGSVEDIAPLLEPFRETVEITIDVSADQVFIGGITADVEAAIESIRKAGFWGHMQPNIAETRLFNAYHTRFAKPLAVRVRKSLEGMQLERLTHVVYSSSDARPYAREPAELVDMFVANATAAVQMRKTIGRMHEDGIRMFVQLGGGGKLLQTIEKNLAIEPHVAVSIDLEYMPALVQLQFVMARMAAMGIDFEPTALHRYRHHDNAALDRLAQRVEQLDAAHAPKLLPVPVKPPVASLPEPVKAPAPAVVVVAAAPPLPVPPRPAQDPNFEQTRQILFQMMANEMALDQQLNEALQKFLLRQISAAVTLTAAPQAAAVTSQPDTSRGLGLTGEVLSLEPGQRLKSRLVLSTRKHRFLAEHALLGMPEGLKPVAERLPTFPFAFSFEVFAAAAKQLVPDRMAIACEEAQAISFLMLKQEELPVIVTAERTADDLVSVSLRVEGANTDAFRGQVRLGTQWPQAPEPYAVPPTPLAPAGTAERYYSEGPFFQGWLYRAITLIDRGSDDIVTGEIEVRTPQDTLGSPGAGVSFFDGLVLDCAAQLLGHTAWETQQRFYVPRYVRRLTRYAELPPGGQRVQVRSIRRPISEPQYEADFDVLDMQGRLLMRAEGWREWWLLWPRALFQTNHRAQTSAISQPLALPDEHACATLLKATDLLDLKPDWLARLYLRPAEWQQYCERPRMDWLLGRVAAKDAVRAWLAQHMGRTLHALEIELGNSEAGEPLVLSPPGLNLTLSISHLDDCAVAVACAAHSVGIDIVHVVERDAAFMQSAFDAKELALMPETNARAWLNRFWAAKEAAAKAHAVGYEGLYRFRIVGVNEKEGAIDVFSMFDDETTRVYSSLHGSLALAYAKGRSSTTALAKHPA